MVVMGSGWLVYRDMRRSSAIHDVLYTANVPSQGEVPKWAQQNKEKKDEA
jgi:hypothetical protein